MKSNLRRMSLGTATQPKALVALSVLCSCWSVWLHVEAAIPAVERPSLPAEVRRQLEAQVAGMRTIHLEYTEEKSGIGSQFQSGPTRYFTSFHEGRFYQRRHDTAPAEGLFRRKIRQIHESAFDGTIFHFGDRERSDAEGHPAILAHYSVHAPTEPNRNMRLVVFPYLDASGFDAPNTIADMTANSSIRSLVLKYLEESESTTIEESGDTVRVSVLVPDRVLAHARRENLEERRKLLASGRNSPERIAEEIETLRRMQDAAPLRKVAFVLDRRYGYGVTERQEWTDAGKLIVHIASDRWEYYSVAGIWLPKRSTAQYYTNPFGLTVFSDRPRTTMRYRLNDAQFHPPHDTPFTLEYKIPGTLIRDRASPEARKKPNHEVTYTVAADGTLLEGAAAEALREIRRQRLRPSWVAVNCLILGVVIFALYLRRKARSSRL